MYIKNCVIKCVFYSALCYSLSSALYAEPLPQYAEPLCFEKEIPEYYMPNRTNKIKHGLFLTTYTVTSIPLLSSDLTVLTSSDCALIYLGRLDLETREKLYFLAFSGRHMMQETGRRSGEYADALTEILGCTQEREVFFESAAGHHTDIFREEEYGLSYAVRLNRLLDAQGLCRETPMRSFLREADLTLSASFPAP